jgi:hypothetical protein
MVSSLPAHLLPLTPQWPAASLIQGLPELPPAMALVTFIFTRFAWLADVNQNQNRCRSPRRGTCGAGLFSRLWLWFWSPSGLPPFGLCLPAVRLALGSNWVKI